MSSPTNTHNPYGNSPLIPARASGRSPIIDPDDFWYNSPAARQSGDAELLNSLNNIRFEAIESRLDRIWRELQAPAPLVTAYSANSRPNRCYVKKIWIDEQLAHINSRIIQLERSLACADRDNEVSYLKSQNRALNIRLNEQSIAIEQLQKKLSALTEYVHTFEEKMNTISADFQNQRTYLDQVVAMNDASHLGLSKTMETLNQKIEKYKTSLSEDHGFRNLTLSRIRELEHNLRKLIPSTEPTMSVRVGLVQSNK